MRRLSIFLLSLCVNKYCMCNCVQLWQCEMRKRCTIITYKWTRPYEACVIFVCICACAFDRVALFGESCLLTSYGFMPALGGNYQLKWNYNKDIYLTVVIKVSLDSRKQQDQWMADIYPAGPEDKVQIARQQSVPSLLSQMSPQEIWPLIWVSIHWRSIRFYWAVCVCVCLFYGQNI